MSRGQSLQILYKRTHNAYYYISGIINITRICNVRHILQQRTLGRIYQPSAITKLPGKPIFDCQAKCTSTPAGHINNLYKQITLSLDLSIHSVKDIINITALNT